MFLMMADFGIKQPRLFRANYRISKPVLCAVSEPIWFNRRLSRTKKMGKVSSIYVPQLSIDRIPLNEVSLGYVR